MTGQARAKWTLTRSGPVYGTCMKSISMTPIYAAKLQSRLVASPSGCHEYTGGLNRKGYGVLYIGDGQRSAHRCAYTLWVGPIPEGMLVCHRCDNPRCCNPKHLFIGTVQDNNRDRDSKGRNISHSGDLHYSRTQPERLARGEGHGMARLNDEKVRLIRESARAGVSLKELAKKLGVHYTLCWQISKGRGWAHVK